MREQEALEAIEEAIRRADVHGDGLSTVHMDALIQAKRMFLMVKGIRLLSEPGETYYCGICGKPKMEEYDQCDH